MWEKQIFEKGQVGVNAVLKESKIVVERREMAVPLGKATKFPWLVWSVERWRKRYTNARIWNYTFANTRDPRIH